VIIRAVGTDAELLPDDPGALRGLIEQCDDLAAGVRLVLRRRTPSVQTAPVIRQFFAMVKAKKARLRAAFVAAVRALHPARPSTPTRSADNLRLGCESQVRLAVDRGPPLHPRPTHRPRRARCSRRSRDDVPDSEPRTRHAGSAAA
jgi:hypothetical protein